MDAAALFVLQSGRATIKANTINKSTVERPPLLSNHSHLLEYARRVLYVVWRSTKKFKSENNPRETGSIEHSNKTNPNRPWFYLRVSPV